MTDKAKQHFRDNAADWMQRSYRGEGHVYPVAKYRADLVLRILGEKGRPLDVADLGCGGGKLAIALGEQGHTVAAVDQAPEMIEIAEQAREALPKKTGDRITFKVADVDGHRLPPQSFDAVSALGVIGYLPDDDILFETAADLLRAGGLFVMSCRNRLFNMNSPSFRTSEEIKSGHALGLLEELRECYQPIPTDAVAAVAERFETLPVRLNAIAASGETPSNEGPKQPTGSLDPKFEARQHTPKQVSATAAKFGLKARAFHGLHPHLIDPNVNWLLPPGFFNVLADCLEPLSQHPVSLAWSSVFVGVFEKMADENG